MSVLIASADPIRLKLRKVWFNLTAGVWFFFRKPSITVADFSPDGALIIIGDDHAVKLWDAASLADWSRFDGHNATITSCGFSPDGTLLVTAAANGSVAILRVPTADLVGGGLAHGRAVRRCGFSPDGSWMFTAAEDGRLKLWSTRGESVCEFWTESSISAIAWRADSGRLVVGDAAGRVYILELRHWQPHPPIVTAHRSPVDGTLGVGCPLCRTWAEVDQPVLGTAIPCPHCGDAIAINAFTIDTDWRAVAQAWQGVG